MASASPLRHYAMPMPPIAITEPPCFRRRRHSSTLFGSRLQMFRHALRISLFATLRR